MSLDNPHPRYLPNNYRPSTLIDDDGSTEFVANARISDHGYIAVVRWDGQRSLIPPHRIHEIERIETERTSKNNSACKGVLDDELVSEALERTGRIEDDDPQQAIADGGTHE
jgi:hypothetical protein